MAVAGAVGELGGAGVGEGWAGAEAAGVLAEGVAVAVFLSSLELQALIVRSAAARARAQPSCSQIRRTLAW